MHAHVSPDTTPEDLEKYGAVVFAATRSLHEAEAVLTRRDAVTIWGVGCHPGLVGAQRSFSESAFASALHSTPYVSEIGLDGSSRVDMGVQIATLTSILKVAADNPRLLAIHSFDATSRVLDVIEQGGARGVILHWWLGDEHETKRAVRLGCYFSVNFSMVSRYERMTLIPTDRMLTETDHSSGDRFSPRPRQPGRVQPAEASVASSRGMTTDQFRRQVWKNFVTLVGTVAPVTKLMPVAVQRMIQYAETLPAD